MSEIGKSIARMGLVSTLPVLIGMAVVSPAIAAGSDGSGLEEVLVTAQKRKQNLQKTPVAVTVVKGEDLNERGKASLREILEDVPNVSFGTTAPTSDSPGTAVVIRGVQPSGGAGGFSTAAPTTAVYVDGVFSGLGSGYDVARIEVLRGPQGTLYGRSATGGVVSIITNDPKLGKLGADVLIEGASAQKRHYSVALNIPIGDSVALRLSGDTIDQDGYHTGLGGHSNSKAYRAKLLIQPSAKLRLQFGAAKQDQVTNSGGTTFTATGPASYTTTTGVKIGTQYYDTQQYWAQADLDLDWADLAYIGSFRKWHNQGLQVLGTGALQQVSNYPLDEFVTHEVRLTSKENDNFKWLLGAFYYENKYENVTGTFWTGSLATEFQQDVNKRTKNIGFFGESTYSFTDKTRVTAGLRLDDTEVQTFGYYAANITAAVGANTSATYKLPVNMSVATLTREQGTRDFKNQTFKLRLEHDLTPVNSVYATVSTGFLPGDSQFTTASGTAKVLTYEQEKVTSYEIGSKNQFYDGRFNLNGDLFFNDYTGYQTAVNTATSGSPTYSIFNAPAQMSGVEVEGRWRLTATDMLNFSYAHIDAKFKDAPVTFTTYISNKNIPGIANDTFTLGYSHDFQEVFGGTLKGQVDARYGASRDLSTLTPTQVTLGYAPWNVAPATTLVNGSLTWYSPAESYSVTAYVRNLTDKVVRSSFSGSNRSTGLTDGRSLGLVLQAHF